MLLAMINHCLFGGSARRVAGWRARAAEAVVPVDEVKLAGVLRTLSGSFTLPFGR